MQNISLIQTYVAEPFNPIIFELRDTFSCYLHGFDFVWYFKYSLYSNILTFRIDLKATINK